MDTAVHHRGAFDVSFAIADFGIVGANDERYGGVLPIELGGSFALNDHTRLRLYERMGLIELAAGLTLEHTPTDWWTSGPLLGGGVIARAVNATCADHRCGERAGPDAPLAFAVGGAAEGIAGYRWVGHAGIAATTLGVRGTVGLVEHDGYDGLLFSAGVMGPELRVEWGGRKPTD